MKRPMSLQLRLALVIGAAVTVLWLIAAAYTAHRLGHELEEAFDDNLQLTAWRMLPLAAHALREHEGRNGNGNGNRDADIGRFRDDDESVAYIVRDRYGNIVLHSGDVARSIFPPLSSPGFSQDKHYRFYSDISLNSAYSITVAEPLDHRDTTKRVMLLGLLFPLLIVIPFSLAAIALALRNGFKPLRGLQQGLAHRNARDLSPLPEKDLPSELRPVTTAMNQLFERLRAAFEAERAFTANAAHELRTPVAGAIAQAQRLQTEASETRSIERAHEIETTLKRLMRMSEKLMQLARAEGGRLRLETQSDLSPVLKIIVSDFERAGETRLVLQQPSSGVQSDLDPDIFAILCRNLIENAQRYGAADRPITIVLEKDGTLVVANEGPSLSNEDTERLTRRFERGVMDAKGSGLGLAIVRSITDRASGAITITSPLTGGKSGVEITVRLPVGAGECSTAETKRF
ncbi:two-component sensor histidine kinase [Martelella alba]|uniref:histidine kinase n=1 Tax=Martelella alba TaxID=2590451 RepID=A0A506UJE0_9HYPH|nr:ATP-binding protein [Martelella alba]TPW33373.1 two-component sensor histidine kinase [Martelella alba]